MKKHILYKVLTPSNSNIKMQVANKVNLFNLAWHELFLCEYLCHIPKNQIFCLGIYYTQNMRNINLESRLSKDSESNQIKKMILSEIRGGNYIILDLKTNRLETVRLAFIAENMELLEDFTSLQCFFLGTRAGIFIKSNVFKK